MSELFFPKEVSRVGKGRLNRLNKFGDASGIQNLKSAVVPGTGNTDSVDTSLPVGSFVIRKKNANFGGGGGVRRRRRFARGGRVGFQFGGETGVGGGIDASVLGEIRRQVLAGARQLAEIPADIRTEMLRQIKSNRGVGRQTRTAGGRFGPVQKQTPAGFAGDVSLLESAFTAEAFEQKRSRQSTASRAAVRADIARETRRERNSQKAFVTSLRPVTAGEDVLGSNRTQQNLSNQRRQDRTDSRRGRLNEVKGSFGGGLKELGVSSKEINQEWKRIIRGSKRFSDVQRESIATLSKYNTVLDERRARDASRAAGNPFNRNFAPVAPRTGLAGRLGKFGNINSQQLLGLGFVASSLIPDTSQSSSQFRNVGGQALATGAQGGISTALIASSFTNPLTAAAVGVAGAFITLGGVIETTIKGMEEFERNIRITELKSALDDVSKLDSASEQFDEIISILKDKVNKIDDDDFNIAFKDGLGNIKSLFTATAKDVISPAFSIFQTVRKGEGFKGLFDNTFDGLTQVRQRKIDRGLQETIPGGQALIQAIKNEIEAGNAESAKILLGQARLEQRALVSIGAASGNVTGFKDAENKGVKVLEELNKSIKQQQRQAITPPNNTLPLLINFFRRNAKLF